MTLSASTTPERPVFADRRLVLCVGPGGVGKTTCAAALGLHAAASGRRVAVVTIDPSRRLAQALGLDREQSGELVSVVDEPGMQLDALILDGAEVFDTIVRDCASDAASAARILDSRIYQATAAHLSGALEFAAMARVQMLADAGAHDLIVLDTPPTANALDFLEAPSRVRELIDNPGARLLASGGRLGAKILGLGSAVLSKTLEAMGGGSFLGDLGAFLREFAEVLAEFQRRGGDFERLLRSRETGVLLVTSAAPFSVREAEAFLAELADYGLRIDAVVLNRIDPELPEPPPRSELEAELGLGAVELDQLLRSYDGARAAGERTRRSIAELTGARAGLRVWTAPRLADPPDSTPELRKLGAVIFREA